MTKSIKSGVTYLINDVSRRVGLSQKRIREYEKAGLVKPARDPGTNNRRFDEKDILQILRIKALIHKHGFTLASLQYMTANMACWAIFDCDKKNLCPGFASPLTPCWEVARKSEMKANEKDCDHCPVYLNRDFQRMALLEKP